MNDTTTTTTTTTTTENPRLYRVRYKSKWDAGTHTSLRTDWTSWAWCCEVLVATLREGHPWAVIEGTDELTTSRFSVVLMP